MGCFHDLLTFVVNLEEMEMDGLLVVYLSVVAAE